MQTRAGYRALCDLDMKAKEDRWSLTETELRIIEWFERHPEPTEKLKQMFAECSRYLKK